MICPKCKKNLKPQARKCGHCGAVFAHRSEQLVKEMTGIGRAATIGGGLMAFLGILVLFYGSGLLGATLLVLGVMLAVIAYQIG